MFDLLPPYSDLGFVLTAPIAVSKGESMAITWDVKITPIDVPRKIVGIVAVATNDVAVRTYTVSTANADISTSAKKTIVLNILWSKFLKKWAEQALLDSIAVEISDLEAAAKTNLEGRTV
jgi:hypothetical protein